MTMVLRDNPAPSIRRLLVNRPEKRNAIDHAVREALMSEIRAARADRTVRAIVIGGVGDHFSAGGDIGSMIELSEAEARERMQHIHQLCRLVADTPLPVVAAAQGYCAGAGLGLALLGDIIVAGSATKFLIPFLKLALAPDWGSVLTLPARVGRGRALRMMTEGRVIPGQEAAEAGLADLYVGDDDVMDAAVAYAQQMAALPADAFARLKRRLVEPSATLDAELQREEDDQAVLLRADDFREGFAAFTERRAPDFRRGDAS